MGDSRFSRPLEEVERAYRAGSMGEIGAEAAIQALGAMASSDRRFLANALATRLLNQFRRSSTLLQHLADGVVALDDEGRVLFTNPAAEEMLGWESGALLGRDFHETVHHRKTSGEHVDREQCAILSVMADPDLDAVRIHDHDVFERKDGSTFMVGLTAAPVMQQGERTGVAVLFRDITQQQENERRLALFGPALDAVPIPIFGLQRDGGILYANTAASDHLGYAREALNRMQVFDFDTDFSQERWDDHWERIRRGELLRIDSHHRTRDGRVVPVHIRVTHVQHGADQFHVAVAMPADPMEQPLV